MLEILFYLVLAFGAMTMVLGLYYIAKVKSGLHVSYNYMLIFAMLTYGLGLFLIYSGVSPVLISSLSLLFATVNVPAMVIWHRRVKADREVLGEETEG